jgi:glycosyltransferase involved in cell wall biosynthesis
MIDWLFSIVLVLNATGLFRFVAPQLGMSIGQVSLALLMLSVFYLLARVRYTWPLFLLGGTWAWLFILALWPILTLPYAPSVDTRDTGLVIYYYSLLLASTVYTLRSGLTGMRRLLSISLAITVIGLAISMLLPERFEAVAALADASIEQKGRPFGFFLEPNKLAIGLGFLFIGWFSLLRRKNSMLEVAAVAVFLCAELVTGSRTGMFIAVATVTLIFAHSWRKEILSGKYLLKICLLIACVAGGVLGINYYLSGMGETVSRREGDLIERMEGLTSLKFSSGGGVKDDISVQRRLSAQTVYWSLVNEKPWLGHGLGADSYYKEKGPILSSSHSAALTCAMEYGVLYPLVFGLLIFLFYRKHGRLDAEEVFQSNSIVQFVMILLFLFIVSGDVLESRTLYVVWGMFFAAVCCPRYVFSYDSATARINGCKERRGIWGAQIVKEGLMAAVQDKRTPNRARNGRRAMRVLQVVSSLTAGGAEALVTHLSVHLAKLGVEVRVFVIGGVRGERGQVLLKHLRGARIEVSGTEERKLPSLDNLMRLAGLIRSWRPDIVHAHLYSCNVACAWARWLAVGSRARYVRTLHSTDICGYRSPTIVKMLSRFYRLTIACSAPVADAYLDFVGEQRKTRLATIPNGVWTLDSVPDAGDRLQARRTLGIPEQAFVVAHIGRMQGGRIGTGLESEPKAQDVLLRAFAEAFGRDPNCVLVLVGDGQLRPEAERLASSLGIHEQTRFLREQPDPWPALKAADMFCFPSRFEGLPLVLVEAASCGLPVVASDIPEIRTLCLGDAWLLAPVDDVSRFANAMLAVRADLERFSSRARETAQEFREKYSMKACAEKYAQAYETLLSQNTKSR